MERQINQTLVPHKFIKTENAYKEIIKIPDRLPEENCNENIYNNQEYTSTTLRQKLERAKEKNKQLNQRIAQLEKELMVGSDVLMQRVEEYENEILSIKELKAQVQRTLGESKDCQVLSAEVNRLKSLLKSKEQETKELLSKKLKDEIADLKYS